MLTGLIDGLQVDGRRFVVQTEDRGAQRGEFVSSAFEGGKLTYRRVVSYRDLVALGWCDQKAVLASALKNLHNHVLKKIERKELILRWTE